MIVAAGSQEMVRGDWVKKSAVVIDCGINVDETGKLRGDVCYSEVAKVAAYVSPVPGGGERY